MSLGFKRLRDKSKCFPRRGLCLDGEFCGFTSHSSTKIRIWDMWSNIFLKIRGIWDVSRVDWCAWFAAFRRNVKHSTSRSSSLRPVFLNCFTLNTKTWRFFWNPVTIHQSTQLNFQEDYNLQERRFSGGTWWWDKYLWPWTPFVNMCNVI